MEDITKIIKSLQETGLLIKGISETIKIEAKEQKGGFLSMLLGTLPARILGKACPLMNYTCVTGWTKKSEWLLNLSVENIDRMYSTIVRIYKVKD